MRFYTKALCFHWVSGNTCLSSIDQLQIICSTLCSISLLLTLFYHYILFDSAVTDIKAMTDEIRWFTISYHDNRASSFYLEDS